GQPFMRVEDANFDNKSELLLRHDHEGVDLDLRQARDTMENLLKVWKRPVNVLTKVEDKGKILRFDEAGFSEKSAEYPNG
ncbi:MAG: SpoVR family protein, partial [Deltaproteobacteria bacterium]|nr:SpoVR family protein [Deltaproteobacteria bacterium]